MATEYSLPSALSHFDPADLLDALSTGIIVLDAQLCAIYANVAAQDLLAFSLNQASIVLENAPDVAAGKRWGARVDLPRSRERRRLCRS